MNIPKYPKKDNETRAMNERRIFSAMVSGLDIAIGQIVKKLKQEGLYENSIILFSSDVRIKFSVEHKIYS